jgi:hypothetical protein
MVLMVYGLALSLNPFSHLRECPNDQEGPVTGRRAPGLDEDGIWELVA